MACIYVLYVLEQREYLPQASSWIQGIVFYLFLGPPVTKKKKIRMRYDIQYTTDSICMSVSYASKAQIANKQNPISYFPRIHTYTMLAITNKAPKIGSISVYVGRTLNTVAHSAVYICIYIHINFAITITFIGSKPSTVVCISLPIYKCHTSLSPWGAPNTVKQRGPSILPIPVHTQLVCIKSIPLS